MIFLPVAPDHIIYFVPWLPNHTKGQKDKATAAIYSSGEVKFLRPFNVTVYCNLGLFIILGHMKTADVLEELERLAPPALQENYDNSGLLVGDRNAELKGVL